MTHATKGELRELLQFLVAKRLQLLEELATAPQGPSDSQLERVVLYHQAIEAAEAAIHPIRE